MIKIWINASILNSTITKRLHVHFAKREPFLNIGNLKQTDLVTRWKNRRLQFINFQQGQFLIHSAPSSLAEIGKVALEKVFKSFYCIHSFFHFLANISPKNSFEQTWILITQLDIVQSVCEIGQVSLRKKLTFMWALGFRLQDPEAVLELSQNLFIG